MIKDYRGTGYGVRHQVEGDQSHIRRGEMPGQSTYAPRSCGAIHPTSSDPLRFKL